MRDLPAGCLATGAAGLLGWLAWPAAASWLPRAGPLVALLLWRAAAWGVEAGARSLLDERGPGDARLEPGRPGSRSKRWFPGPSLVHLVGARSEPPHARPLRKEA